MAVIRTTYELYLVYPDTGDQLSSENNWKLVKLIDASSWCNKGFIRILDNHVILLGSGSVLAIFSPQFNLSDINTETILTGSFSNYHVNVLQGFRGSVIDADLLDDNRIIALDNNGNMSVWGHRDIIL
jgi:hypothetical protein